MATVGEAIALGNLAKPDTTKVFTQGVMRKQQLDLAKAERKAKEDKERKELEKTFAGMMDMGKGGFLPLYQEQARDLTATSNAEMMMAIKRGDPIMASSIKQRSQTRLEDLMAENNAFKTWMETSKSGGLVPKELVEITSLPMSQAKKRFTEVIAKNPEYKELLDFDQANNRFVFNPVKDVPVEKEIEAVVQSLKSSAKPVGKEKLMDGTYNFTFKADETALSQAALDLAANPDIAANIRIKKKQEYLDAYNRLSNMPGPVKPTPAQLKELAVIEVLANDLKKRGQYREIRQLSTGGSGQQVIPPQRGQPVAINVFHPDANGVEREFAANSLYSAQVELTQGGVPTTLVKDAKSGKPVDSTEPIQFLKSAVVQVYPFYTKAKAPLSGRIVPDQNVDKLRPDQYEWRAVVVGVNENDEQILAEFDTNNTVMNMLKKGSKDREAQTMADVNMAKKIAAEENNKKSSKRPATTTKQNKVDLSKFDKTSKK
jgi:hypothetical protein